MCLFKEGSGRAMCSNSAPGCSQEYFSLRSEKLQGGTSRSPRAQQKTSRRIQGGPKECSGRAMCSNNVSGCSQEYFSLRSEKLQGGPKEGPLTPCRAHVFISIGFIVFLAPSRSPTHFGKVQVQCKSSRVQVSPLHGSGLPGEDNKQDMAL